MQIISNSQYFKIQDDVALTALKKSLVAKLCHNFHVETVGDAVETFEITAGGRRKFAGTIVSRLTLNVALAHENGCARIQLQGHVELSNSAKMMYCLAVLFVLLIGLFPGSIDTSSDGGPLDALVFLVIGGFIMHDVNQKMNEPETLLRAALKQVESEFALL